MLLIYITSKVITLLRIIIIWKLQNFERSTNAIVNLLDHWVQDGDGQPERVGAPRQLRDQDNE